MAPRNMSLAIPSYACFASSIVATLILLGSFSVAVTEDAAPLPKVVTEVDAIAGQLSTTGGFLQKKGDEYFLELTGVMPTAIVASDPTDATTGREVEHNAISPVLPRFGVLMANNSRTNPSPSTTIPSFSLIILDMVGHEAGKLRYKVDPIGKFQEEEVPEGSVPFDTGILLLDLTPEGHAVDNEKNVVESDHQKSLRWLMENTVGLETGSVPITLNGTKVGAQGVFSTAFLGPFNAWAWMCCGYKFATAWTVINPASWIFWPICCM